MLDFEGKSAPFLITALAYWLNSKVLKAKNLK